MSEQLDFFRYILSAEPGRFSAVSPRVRLQQHLDTVRTMHVMAFVTLFNTAIAGYIAHTISGETMVFAWMLTNVLTAGVMLLDHCLKAGRPTPKAVSGRYVTKTENLAVFMGAIFGALPLYQTSDPFWALVFGCLFSVSMGAGLMCVMQRNPRIVVRYTFGVVAPLYLHMVIHFSDRMVALGIGLTLLVFTIYFGARQAFMLYLKEVKSVEESNQLREILEVALEGSGQAFAVRAKDGTVVFQNELYARVKPALRNMESAGGIAHALDRYWQTASYEVASIGSVEIFTDVTSIEDSRQEAESLRQEADEASSAKSRFLRSVTSELLVPLRTIRMQASMMDAGSRIPVTKADMNRAADQIRLLTESLEGRVEQIIGYASGDATQEQASNPEDLTSRDENPVLKLESFLARSLRASSGS